MLTHLTVKNYTLIHRLEMDFAHSLNVITGETGTGKSIVLGALGLLIGQRADAKTVGQNGDKCFVEGLFKTSAYELEPLFEEEDLDLEEPTVLRREVTRSGKSRAFVNDTPVTLEVMKKIGGRLMNIHSQHDTLALKNKRFQLDVIDLYARNQTQKAQYEEAWKTRVAAHKQYERLVQDAEDLRKDADFVAYQLEELHAANLEEAEQSRLESELAAMEHAEDIKAALNTLLSLLSRSEGAVDALLTEARSTLEKMNRYTDAYSALYRRVESLWIEVNDIATEIEQEEEKVEYDPDRIAASKDRLDLINKLLHKHRLNSVAELLQRQRELAEKTDQYAGMTGSLKKAKDDLDRAESQLQTRSRQLREARKKAFTPFCEQIVGLLRPIGMVHARLGIAHREEKAGPTGADALEWLFSANKGVPERPLTQVASGGEFSRLMFCIRYVLAKKTHLPTLILDEIDSGISGEIAIRMGAMMKGMAQRCQLIVISHLPQIAAKAERHFDVHKRDKEGKTISHIKQLDDNERVIEIARMIGGEKPSQSAVESARELMRS